MPNKAIQTFIAAGALVFATSASAILLDFESLNQAGTGFNDAGSLYQESGFELTAVANFLSPQTGNVANWAGSTALFNNGLDGVTALSMIGGGIFSLDSMDLTEIAVDRLGPTTVSFVGNQQGGGVLNASIRLDGVFGFESMIFSGWDNLLSVSWRQTPLFHQFDNILLTAVSVPEPGTLSLLGIALVGMGLARRRKKA